MSEVRLIGVPFDGYGRPGNQARAAAVLREQGIEAAAPPAHSRILDLPDGTGERGAETSLANEAALLATTDALEREVSEALLDGAFPVVYGGDCSGLLGVMAGLVHAIGASGLVFVDGHEDTMPLDVSEDGEAANTEIGLLLGITGSLLRGRLRRCRGLVDRESLAVLGPRDGAWRSRFNVGSLREHGVWLADAREVAAAPSAIAAAAVTHVRANVDRWWLHVDLDVLDPMEFPAQGLPDVEDEPGGLSWPELTDALTSAIRAGGCVGWSLTIYDPDQDDSRECARRIVQLVHDVLAAAPLAS